MSYVDTSGADGIAGRARRHRRHRRGCRHRCLLERHSPGAGDGDGGAARPGAVLRRPAQGHDPHALPVQHPALPGGAGARLVRLPAPRPGARAGHAGARRRRHPPGGVGAWSGSTRPPTPSRASAPARCSRSSWSREPPPADRSATRSPRACAPDRGRQAARPASGCPASPSWRGRWASRAARCARGSRCSRRTAWCARLHGSGTYVTHRPLMRNDLSRNFGVTSMIAAMGLEPGHRDERCGREPAPAEVAEALGVEPGAPVSALRRVRTADGRPVVDAIDWCRTGPDRPRRDARPGGSARSTRRWPGAACASTTAWPRMTPDVAADDVAERLAVPPRRAAA